MTRAPDFANDPAAELLRRALVTLDPADVGKYLAVSEQYVALPLPIADAAPGKTFTIADPLNPMMLHSSPLPPRHRLRHESACPSAHRSLGLLAIGSD